MLSLNDINEMKPWIISFKRCPFCEKEAKLFARSETKKKECSSCFQKRVEDYLSGRDISGWVWKDVSSALSDSGSMADRLTALIHFKKFQTEEELPQLLIKNIGFVSSHPLARFTRQKAFETLFQFNDRRKIFNSLLNFNNYNSWQQKANIVIAAYQINSSDIRAKELVRQMACDSSPNVRQRVAYLIKNNKKIWARTLLNKLKNDINPLVREVFTEDTKQNINPSFKPRGKINYKKMKKKQDAFYYHVNIFVANNLQILKNYQKIYDLYLSHLPDLMDKSKYTKSQLDDLKKNNKTSFIKLFTAALTDKALFAAVLEKLPKLVVLLLYICIYELHKIDENLIDKKLLFLTDGGSSDNNTAVSDDNDSVNHHHAPSDNIHAMKLHEIIKTDPAFFMFETRQGYIYGYNYSNVIFINNFLRPYIEKLLPVQNFIAMEPLQDISDRVDHIHKGSHDILRQLPVILHFILQGHLIYNTYGSKILVTSLKKMKKICRIEEYYTDGNKELDLFKTRMMADFLNCILPWKPEELKNLPTFIKKRLNLYFSSKDFKSYNCRDGFDHIKPKTDYYRLDENEKIIRGNLKNMLKLLPEKKWIPVIKLAQTLFYRGINFNPFDNQYEMNSLYIMMEGDNRYSINERIYVRELFIFDVITLPFIKRMMFLFGALGIVDLGYSTPENTMYQQYKKPWLTVYDGLKYVRLTKLGSYVLGRTKSFKTDITIESSEIDIDKNKTILSIYGEDPIKQMLLESMGNKINKSSYMVDFQSFLKDCSTSRDVENKIKFFRKNISAKPPAVWENFFKDVLARINPIEQVEDVIVFRIKPDRKLISLLTTDKILKQYIIKAENYHIIVKSSDFSKIKRRLSVLGFFLN